MGKARTKTRQQLQQENEELQARLAEAEETIRAIREQEELPQANEQLAAIKEELQRSNKDLGQFVYAASHDLQEPLRNISGFLDLLLERFGAQLDGKAREYIGYAVDSANRMSDLINDLLAYSRVDRRRREFGPTDASGPLSAALANLRTSIREAGATITHDSLPTVSGDETQLTQLFQNLIGNAIKFRKANQPCEIHVGAERRRGRWVISVRDNGIGIAPDQHERVFQIFRRLHPRGEYPGTGIGLAICKRIVERHGGRIWVESQPGVGSTFHFTLPSP
ncbi:MAG: hypothetical protein LAP85_13485 [Acidobacteriia bacterium]|nr:hypothetical protein [Terriglobia bacterium]